MTSFGVLLSKAREPLFLFFSLNCPIDAVQVVRDVVPIRSILKHRVHVFESSWGSLLVRLSSQIKIIASNPITINCTKTQTKPIRSDSKEKRLQYRWSFGQGISCICESVSYSNKYMYDNNEGWSGLGFDNV